ncbi:MAG: DNA polymerase III subunit delta [Candidatus Saccharimonadales bacterium]
MVYFFYGDNTYAAKEQISKLIERYHNSMGSDFGLSRFESDADIDSVVASLTSLPMLANNSLVIIEHPSKNKAMISAIEANIDRVPDETVVVIYDPEVDKRSKWYKFIKNVAKNQEFTVKSEGALINWLQRYAKDQGFNIDSKLSRKLIDKVGSDQWRLSREIDKLASIEDISEEHIDALVLPNPRHTIFELIDVLSSGDIASGLSYYDDLKQQNIHDLEILTMLGWQLRNLIVVAHSGNSPDHQIAKEHGINPYVVSKSRRVLRNTPVKYLENAYKQVIEADYSIKTGQSSDSSSVLERVMLNIAKVTR